MLNVYAADLATDSEYPDIATIKGFESLFQNVLSYLLGFAAIVLFVMLIVGGFNLLTAGSDAGKVQSAQKTLTWAIGGLVFMVVAYLILRIIAYVTGVDSILIFKTVQ